MWPTDFLRLGEWSVFTCSLCFSPCKEEGLVDVEVGVTALAPEAGEQGVESAGLEDKHESELPESTTPAEMEVFRRMAWPEATMGRDWRLWDAERACCCPETEDDASCCCISWVAFLELSFRKRDVFLRLSASRRLLLRCFEAVVRRAILIA